MGRPDRHHLCIGSLVAAIPLLLSIWIVGVLIDQYLRAPTLARTVLFGLSALVLGTADTDPIAVWNTAIADGGIFGGVLLDRLGIGAFFPALLVLLRATLLLRIT